MQSLPYSKTSSKLFRVSLKLVAPCLQNFLIIISTFCPLATALSLKNFEKIQVLSLCCFTSQKQTSSNAKNQIHFTQRLNLVSLFPAFKGTKLKNCQNQGAVENCTSYIFRGLKVKRDFKNLQKYMTECFWDTI